MRLKLDETSPSVATSSEARGIERRNSAQSLLHAIVFIDQLCWVITVRN